MAHTNPAPRGKADKIQSLELAIEEQRKDYDSLHGLDESVKVKNYTLLAAALGALTYLYTTTNKTDPIQKRLFLPNEIYGIIFYAVGFLLLIGSVIALMVALNKKRQWETAYENGQSHFMNDYEKYLEYIHKRYEEISQKNGPAYERKLYLIDSSFLPLVIGAMILLLLKTFGD